MTHPIHVELAKARVDDLAIAVRRASTVREPRGATVSPRLHHAFASPSVRENPRPLAPVLDPTEW